MDVFGKLQNFLERLDYWRNQFLYFFIKPLWPRQITPNQITWFRIVLGLYLALLLFWFGIEDRQMIPTVFFIGILSDFIDGPVARCLHKTTDFGAMLDPIADRILIMPIAIYSLFKFHKWLLLCLILVELAEGISSVLAKSKGASVKSNIFGKTKMVIQSLVFVAILFSWPNPPLQILLDILWLSIPLCLLSILHKVNETYKPKKMPA